MFDEAGLNYPPAKYGDKYVLPGGWEVDWNWETLTNIAKVPDRRCERQHAGRPGPSDEFVAERGVRCDTISCSTATCRSISTRTMRPPSWAGAAKLFEVADGKAVASIPDSWARSMAVVVRRDVG